ncbi:hypothetical protein C0Q70_19541 [Pomacea canaliculata]|uniref:Sugar phosphate transporter domain-containing protein n=1 Tax=Pomacea canaliculata TaxID=400727 RepID=A0A2T7NJN8_POMCA|nr:solute carrier family 35 member C2-like [Pomacea canaliculata]XP_025116034.1 solute carrier family 35 member C2-like [Pomacea canaliculata]XP_025116035.1 solute carrier family 35 member C2-like [Pomacea canaliculata]PVD21368.1 hypothetical protein C0Q70_19541 [Pomacea canaliculata]
MAKQTAKRKQFTRELRLLRSTIKPRAEEVKRSICTLGYATSMLKTLFLIVFYYCFSIGITFYNQHFIQEYKLPLSFTMAHLVWKFMAAGFIRWIMECCSKEERTILTWKEYLKRVAPTGFISALDIGLSNWSFDFITISLYTMTKSSAVIFILAFSLLFRLEKCRSSLVIVVLFIAGGLFMFTYHSTEFNLEGFLMVLAASVLSGLRWTLAQMILQKHELGLHHPLDMMYHIQPWMILTLLPLSAATEGIKMSSMEALFRSTDINDLATKLALVFAGAMLAFGLEFSEFLLVSNTSSLTFSVSGIVKELCILYLAINVKGENINVINGIGLVVCLIGISLHVILKAVYARKDREEKIVHSLSNSEEIIDMLMRNGDPNVGSVEDDEEEELFSIAQER